MDKKKASKAAKELVREYVSEKNEHTDPNGSWTGCPENRFEVPVQDADDL